jgi:hypothetical protein
MNGVLGRLSRDAAGSTEELVGGAANDDAGVPAG